MKFSKQIILIFITSLNLVSFGQTAWNRSLECYNEGLQMVMQKKYKEAELLFTKSVNILPYPDTYYCLAIVKNKLMDTCGYCQNMLNASIYGDSEASDLYNSKCFKVKIITYSNSLQSDSVYFSTIKTQICSGKREQNFSVKNQQNGNVTTFYFAEDDSVLSKDYDFETTFPDLNKISPDRILYVALDQLPEYYGGDENRIRFLQENIKYPQMAKEEGIQGVVLTSFDIEKDGSLSNIKIISGIGGGCDEECIRIVKMMPKWKPAKKGNKLVKVKFTMAIKFTLT